MDTAAFPTLSQQPLGTGFWGWGSRGPQAKGGSRSQAAMQQGVHAVCPWRG